MLPVIPGELDKLIKYLFSLLPRTVAVSLPDRQQQLRARSHADPPNHRRFAPRCPLRPKLFATASGSSLGEAMRGAVPDVAGNPVGRRPGERLWKNITLLPEPAVLATQTARLLLLDAAQHVRAPTVVTVGLLHPGVDDRGARLELLRKFIDAASGPMRATICPLKAAGYGVLVLRMMAPSVQRYRVSKVPGEV